MLFKKQVIVFSLLLVRTLTFSQDCGLVLKGIVRDEDNSESLDFAIVKILSLQKAVQTNEKGEFEIGGLCAGDYQVLVQHVGCRDTVFAVQLQKSRKVVFRLPHHLNTLSDIEVVGQHEDTRPTQTSASLEGKTLDNVRGMNLAEQLKELNGVSTFNTGPTVSKPVINGMQGYRILILNNGVRQEGQQWGTEHAPEIDPFVAGKLTVLRGASAVRYGSDAIGGVILVEPAAPDTATLSAELNLVGNSNGRGGVAALQVQGYLDRMRYFSWRVQGSFRQSGDIRTPAYYLRNTGLNERNFSYSLSYHRKHYGFSAYYSQFNSKVGIFTGAHIGNLTDLNAAFRRSKPQDSLAGFSYEIGRPYQNVEHELIKLGSDLHTGQRSRINFTYALQTNIRQEFDKHARNTETPQSDYRLTTHSGEICWEHDYIRSFRGKFGVQGLYQQNTYRELFFIPNYIAASGGVFAIERFIRSGYELEAGLRYDVRQLQSFYYIDRELVSPQRSFSNTTFHIGSIVKLAKTAKLNVHLASGWRAPAVNELYSNGLHHGVAAIERGKSDLGAEYSTNVGASFSFSHRKLSAEATGFFYRFDNYIYYLPGGQPELTLRGAFPVFYHTQNKADIGGGDLVLNYKPSGYLSVNFRSMWVRGYNRDSDEPLVYMPADRYELGFTISLRDSRVFTDNYLKPVYQFVDKQVRVPSSIDFIPPPDAYQLLSFHAGTTLHLGKQPLMLGFSVTNILNTVYRDYLDRFRYYSDAAGRNFTLRIKMPLTLISNKSK